MDKPAKTEATAPPNKTHLLMMWFCWLFDWSGSGQHCEDEGAHVLWEEMVVICPSLFYYRRGKQNVSVTI